MALKGDRVIIETDITMSCPTAALRGVVLVNTTTGSGVDIGSKAGVASLVANPSGYTPVGMLMNDMVNIDVTRYHLNFQKDERLIGDRCTLLRKGKLTTDQVTGSPTAGKTAYLTASGVLTPTMSATGGLIATPKVGVFAGAPDENGFCTVDITLPFAN